MDPLELTPTELDCMRCGGTATMRVPGLCDECRARLWERFRPQARDIPVERYEPTMHVTPNAVALKDD